MSATQQLRDRIKEEYKKCAVSADYFLTKYSYIQHPVRGRMLFDLYHYQKDTLQAFESHDYNIILKGRQIGISTLVAGYALWLLLFHNDKNVLVIATKQETAKNLVTKVRFMHSNLPVWLRGSVITDNKLSLQFANGSQIKAVASSKDAGRSEALSLLILDEAAFIDDADIIWTAASSTLSTGGKAILLSTPNGVGNFFHKMWQQAESKENNFNPVMLDWQVHPERDQAWRDRQTELMGELQASQEHDASFIFSGNTVIPAEIIEFYKASFVQEPITKGGFDGNLWIWEYAQHGKSYIVCADVARGDGSDYSAFHVIDATTCEQVAEYKSQVDTRTFGNMLVSVATEYNNALLVVENANIGWDVVNTILEKGYEKMYYSPRAYGDMSMDKWLDKMDREQTVPGFTTSVKTRPLVISKMESYIREKVFTFHSKRLLEELRVFVWQHGKAQAQNGYNDDLVMALGMGLFTRDTAMKFYEQGMDLNRAMVSNITRTTYGYTGPVLPDGVQNPYMMDNGHGEFEDMTWVLS